MALRVLRSFEFDRVAFVEYLCEEVGDELPLHSHTFNHLTLAVRGRIRVFTDDNSEGLVLRIGDAPAEYVAGRLHGIRALDAGAVFLNISPVVDRPR
jgi:quercetin dioxygenase-like cupin family protein